MHIATKQAGKKRENPLLYQSFQAIADATLHARMLSSVLNDAFHNTWRGAPFYPASKLAALLELISLAGLTHARPEFAIGSVESNGVECAVREEVVLARPFGSLLRFRQEGPPQQESAPPQPRVLVVAPMSGH